jgi:signal transduction histidine kinase
LQSQEECARIARELHNSAGQQLILIKRRFQNLEQAEISTLTNNALEEVRSISRGLYPIFLK